MRDGSNSEAELITMIEGRALPGRFRLIVAAFAITSCSPIVVAGDNCLGERWNELPNPVVESQKDYDRKHDQVGNGSLTYSCNVFTTPSEVKKVLDDLKAAVLNDDVTALSLITRFPLNVSTSESYVTADGHIRLLTYQIESPEHLKLNFKEIFSDDQKSFVACLSVENLDIHPYRGLSAAFGGIWINRSIEDRQLRLQSISIVSSAKKRWMAENCDKKET